MNKFATYMSLVLVVVLVYVGLRLSANVSGFLNPPTTAKTHKNINTADTIYNKKIYNANY